MIQHYNQRTGQIQNSAGGLYDAHIKPVDTTTRTENNVNTAIMVFLTIILFIWYIKFTWNWCRWIVRHSGAYFSAALVFVFHLLWGLWFVCELLDPDGIYAVTGDSLAHNLLDYVIVMGFFVWLTACRYLATPTDKKMEIARKNKEDRENATTNGLIGEFLGNPIVIIPLSFWIGRRIA